MTHTRYLDFNASTESQIKAIQHVSLFSSRISYFSSYSTRAQLTPEDYFSLLENNIYVLAVAISKLNGKDDGQFLLTPQDSGTNPTEKKLFTPTCTPTCYMYVHYTYMLHVRVLSILTVFRLLLVDESPQSFWHQFLSKIELIYINLL